jgi:hypothetical protein
MIHLYSNVFKQSKELVNSAEFENFKSILDTKETPYIFRELMKENFESVNIDQLIKENLSINREIEDKSGEAVKDLLGYFDKDKKNDVRREIFSGRVLTLEKYFVYFPEFLKYYYDTLEVLMLDNNGSLPVTWRYYIALMVKSILIILLGSLINKLRVPTKNSPIRIPSMRWRNKLASLRSFIYSKETSKTWKNQ